MNRIYKSAVLLFALNGVAGVLNYLFLLLAARRLSSSELGDLAFALNLFNLVMISGSVVQYWSLFSALSRETLRKCYVASWIAVGIFVSILLSSGFHLKTIVWSLVFAVPLSISLQFLVGRFQRGRWFGWFGAGGAVWALCKFGLAWFAQSGVDFATAIPVATAVSVSLALLLPKPEDSAEANGESSNWVVRLKPALATALAHAWLPAFDLVVVRLALGSDTAGHLSKLQLFSKAIYYAPLALLQISLPISIRVLAGGKEKDWPQLVKLERIGISVCFLAVFGVAGLGAWVSESIMGVPGLTRLELFLACAGVIPLYGLLRAIQLFSASGRMRVPLILLLVSFGSSAVATQVHWDSLTAYLAYSATMSFILGSAGWYLSRQLLLKNQTR